MKRKICVSWVLLFLDSMPDHFRFLGNGGSKGISVWYAGSRVLLIPSTPQRHQSRFVYRGIGLSEAEQSKAKEKGPLSSL
jgi:hypothetical protein